MQALYFVDFLDKYAQGLALLILAALVVIGIIGVSFARNRGEK
jgi:hypothetical protein